MRVTQGMLTQQFLYNLSNINQRIEQEQTQSSTGKTLNKPADNPLAVSQDMAIRATLAQATAYQGVISTGLSWMNNTSSVVQNMITTLQSIQTNVNEASSMTTANPSAINALLDTTQQLVNQLYSDANATQGNNYLFSGTQLSSSGSSIASEFMVKSTSGTIYYDTPGTGTASNGISQTVTPEPIAASLTDQGGLIALGQSYNIVFDATNIGSNGAIQSGTIELTSSTGSIIASGTIPASSVPGSIVTLTATTGTGNLAITLGSNLYQLTPVSGVSGTSTYSQTDVITSGTGTNSSIGYEVSQNVNISINLTAAQLFHQSPDGTTPDLQTNLSQIIMHMSAMSAALANNPPNMSSYQSQLANLQGDFGNLQSNTNQVINMNALLGTRIQRMQAIQQQLNSYSLSITTEKSTLEDANMASVLTQYSTDQTVYQSALAIGAKILLPTLLTYLPNG